MAEPVTFDPNSENLYAIRLGAAARQAGRVAVQYSEFFDGREMSEKEAWVSFTVNVLEEPLALLLNEENSNIIFDYPTEKIWNTKGISLKNREEKDPSLSERVEKLLTPDTFRKYVVAVDMKAPARCIDGRPIKGWTDDQELRERGLGPKIAGATAHAALAHRIVMTDSLSESIKEGNIFTQDILDVIRIYREAGIGFGIHIDDHAKGSNTGCGAIDNIDVILDKIKSSAALQQVRALTKSILGDNYEPRVVNDILSRMTLLDAAKPKYMPKENDDPNGEFLYKKTVVDSVNREAEEQEKPVEQLEGPHNEVALILNFVKGSTIDTDKLSNDTNGEIQVFGWDVWEIFNEAERLFPYNNTDGVEVQHRAIENRVKHVTARTILGIATAMVLTDGSLRVVMLKEDSPA